MIVGQLVEVVHKLEENDNWWEYGVVKNVFDDRVLIQTESNTEIMHQFKSAEEEKIGESWINSKNIKVIELYKNGQAAVAKKNIFGKYKLGS